MFTSIDPEVEVPEAVRRETRDIGSYIESPDRRKGGPGAASTVFRRDR
jgi:hypothetical protein